MKEFVKLDRIGGINGSGIYFYTMRRAERNYFYLDEYSYDGWYLCSLSGRERFYWNNDQKYEITKTMAIRGKYKGGRTNSYYDLFFIEWSDKKIFLKVADKRILDYFMQVEKIQYDTRSHFYISEGGYKKNQELFTVKPPVPFIEITHGEITGISTEDYPSCDGRSKSTKELEEIELIKIWEVPYGPD